MSYFALGRFSAHVARVVVRFGDINGPRGGLGKALMLDVRLKHTGRILIREVDTSVASVIDAAAQLASRALAREMRLKRDLHEPLMRRSLRRGPALAPFGSSATGTSHAPESSTALAAEGSAPDEGTQ